MTNGSVLSSMLMLLEVGEVPEGQKSVNLLFCCCCLAVARRKVGLGIEFRPTYFCIIFKSFHEHWMVSKNF